MVAGRRPGGGEAPRVASGFGRRDGAACGCGGVGQELDGFRIIHGAEEASRDGVVVRIDRKFGSNFDSAFIRDGSWVGDGPFVWSGPRPFCPGPFVCGERRRVGVVKPFGC